MSLVSWWHLCCDMNINETRCSVIGHICVVVCQVMKKLMNIQLDFWLRYVNVDDDMDDEAENTEPAADG